MDGWLREDTAVTVPIGPFVDSTGAKLTALTISQADVVLSKHNSTTFAQKNDATSCTHRSNGVYTCPLDTTDTNTPGLFNLQVEETGALIVKHTWMIVPQAVWDAFFGSGTLTVASTSNVKKNQALANFEFVMTDSTTHAPVTGKTVTCTRSIDGGAFASGTLANVAEVANGIYKVDFGAGDLNGNVITLRATAATSDDRLVTIVTQP